MWSTLVVVIFLERIYALLPTTPPPANTQSNRAVSYPNGSLLGNEMWLMGITVRDEELEVTHHCLGINIWHTGKVLTTCSCLAKAHEGRPTPYSASLASVFWNPAFLGWGEDPVVSKRFRLSAHCKPRKVLPLPWSSDLAILDTKDFVQPFEYAREIDVDLPPSDCMESDEPLFEETFSSWSPKMCSEELFWTTKQAQLQRERCNTFITEGEYNRLMLREVQIIPWHDCERLVCDMYPDLCDISLELTGILCTTRPSTFNTCLPIGSPLICDQAVLGLYSRPRGEKWTCNQTFPVLMYSSLARVTTKYHDFLSSKDKKLICECFKKCALSGCVAILPRFTIVSAVLTIFTILNWYIVR